MMEWRRERLITVVIDRAGVIVDVDPGVIDVLMIPPGDLVGHPFVEYVDAPDRRRVKDCFESCVGLRIHAIAEVQLVRRDGSLMLAQLASYPKWEGAANVISCRIQIHDISELKRAQARLSLVAEASAILGGPLTQPLRLDRVAALLVPTLADACLIDVAVGTDQLRRAAAFIGDELREVAASTHNLVRLPMRVESQTYGELTLICQPARLLSEADLDVARDLAERIAQALQNSQAHERSQRALRERDDGLAFVTHDMRNLLTVLFLDTAEMLRATPIPERRRGSTRLDRILYGIRSMRRMVDDLSDLSEGGHGMNMAMALPASSRTPSGAAVVSALTEQPLKKSSAVF